MNPWASCTGPDDRDLWFPQFPLFVVETTFMGLFQDCWRSRAGFLLTQLRQVEVPIRWSSLIQQIWFFTHKTDQTLLKVARTLRVTLVTLELWLLQTLLSDFTPYGGKNTILDTSTVPVSTGAQIGLKLPLLSMVHGVDRGKGRFRHEWHVAKGRITSLRFCATIWLTFQIRLVLHAPGSWIAFLKFRPRSSK